MTNAFTVFLLFVAFVAIYGSPFVKTNNRRDVKRIKDEDMATLTSVYNLMDGSLGGFKVAQTWQSAKTSNGDPEATSYLLVLNDGACGSWVEMAEKDRLYIWHGGKTYIDMIDSAGDMTTKCLGDTLEDASCRYIVHLPAGSKTDIRVQDYVYYTGIVLMGTSKDDGVKFAYQDIFNDYQDHLDIIKLTEKCYPTSS